VVQERGERGGGGRENGGRPGQARRERHAARCVRAASVGERALARRAVVRVLRLGSGPSPPPRSVRAQQRIPLVNSQTPTVSRAPLLCCFVEE
jgi:hypothetical protein